MVATASRLAQHLLAASVVDAADPLAAIGGRELRPRELDVLGVRLDRVDMGAGGSVHKPQRRIAERRADLDDPACPSRPPRPAEQRALAVEVGTAAVVLAVTSGRIGDLRESVGHAQRRRAAAASAGFW